MKTTLILDDTIKQKARIKALQENKNLSEVVNYLLEDYVKGSLVLKERKSHYLDEITQTDLGQQDFIVDREFIYDLK